MRFDEFSARAVRVRLGQAAGRQLDSPVLLCVADFSTKILQLAGYNMAEWTLDLLNVVILGKHKRLVFVVKVPWNSWKNEKKQINNNDASFLWYSL